ncbi:NAD(P)H-binding protein [Paenimyroides aestuarii]|uniref:NAD(P)H-binding protein n=1 Tax=Paenimyroides aestuarii TaxID=2968490 RepID=A0ABY5NUS6_9FLAO|nr:NAD(P)H-binding protein [Paenimyroides aestuarii]UUV22204.1 NAD(P)H-binding protein [Paenimyroides aestuarii]
MNIAILGAGWLGTELAKVLSKNHTVKVSVTTNEKKELLQTQGLNAFTVVLSLNGVSGSLDFFKNVDVLICTLTPQAVAVFYPLADVLKKHAIKNVVVCSSTGIYQDCEGIVKESSALKLTIPKVQLLKSIEDVFLTDAAFNATILRLGGLIGKNRHPVKHLAKKDQITDGNEPVNIVYQDTILKTICLLLKQPLLNTVFNLVETDHRTKEVFYQDAAKEHDVSLPPFSYTSSPKNRVVSTEKIESFLDINP